MKLFSLNNLWKLSHLAFLGLLLLSVVFAIERVCYIDSAYMLFRMVNTESIIAEGGRLTNAIPQFIPWLMIKAGLSLNSIVIGFSFMDIAVLYAVFLLVGIYFRQKLLASIFVILLMLGVSSTFFDVVTETKAALAIAVILTAALSSDNKTPFWLLILIVFSGIFSHPVFILYFFIIIAFFYSKNDAKKYGKLVLAGSILIGLKIGIIGATVYEQNLLSINHLYESFQHSFIHEYISIWLDPYYIALPVIMLVVVAYLTINKKWKFLLFYMLSIISLYIILAVIYSAGDSRMMIQKTMFVLHFTMLLPLVKIDEKNNFLFKFISPLFFVVLLTTFYSIINASSAYRERVIILTDFLKKLPAESDKYLIHENNINHDKIMATWALSHETLLLSNIKYGKSLALKNFRDHNDTLQLSKYPNAFRPAFGYPIKKNELNEAYFNPDWTKENKWLDSAMRLGF
ncbi:MAG: hypothetical protein V4613_06410 [Bacteroidota bacterium]